MALRSYLATEIAIDHADGLLSRRDALHKLGLLGLTTVAASSLLASCSSEAPSAAPGAAPGPSAAPGNASQSAATPTAPPDYDVVAARARSEDVTFPGGTGTM
jgi:carboxymethylenebutenolidase